MKKSMILLLVCCMVALSVQAQLTYKDSKYGWSVTLPEGWAILPNDDQGLPQSTSYVTFIYNNQQTELLLVAISAVDSKYKGSTKQLIKMRQQEFEKRFTNIDKDAQDAGINAKITNGKQTISGKSFTTSKITLLSGSDKMGDNLLYIWANSDYEMQILSGHHVYGDASVPAMIDKAIIDIVASLKL